MSAVIFTAKGAKTANKNGSVPCSPETVPGRERGKENGVSPVFFNREMCENRESLCSLFLLVRAVRVARGS